MMRMGIGTPSNQSNPYFIEISLRRSIDRG
jgi:hypothetical protein